MLAFIKKDLLTIKKDLKIYLLMFVVITVFMGWDISKLTLLLGVYIFMTVFVSFGYDENSNFIGYSASLPNGRKRYVIGKYGSFLILLALAMILSIMVIFVGNLLGKDILLSSSLETIPSSIFFTFLIVALSMPIMFKFGANKFRFVFFIVIFGGSFLVGRLTKYVDLSGLKSLFDMLNNPVILMALGTIVLIISYFISLMIINNKEY